MDDSSQPDQPQTPRTKVTKISDIARCCLTAECAEKAQRPQRKILLCVLCGFFAGSAVRSHRVQVIVSSVISEEVAVEAMKQQAADYLQPGAPRSRRRTCLSLPEILMNLDNLHVRAGHLEMLTLSSDTPLKQKIDLPDGRKADFSKSGRRDSNSRPLQPHWCDDPARLRYRSHFGVVLRVFRPP